MSQANMSDTLGIGQMHISRLEQRKDPTFVHDAKDSFHSNKCDVSQERMFKFGVPWMAQ
jgi:hypothetical protein